MPEIDVEFFAPVTVTVDTDTEEVVRVVVDDQNAQPMPRNMQANEPDEDALAIAESAEWPSWDIGA